MGLVELNEGNSYDLNGSSYGFDWMQRYSH